MTFTLLLAILHLSGKSSLSGVVRSADSTSAPIDAALVEVTSTGSADSSLRIVTDSLGRYQLPDLPTGTYHLRVSRIGFDARELDVLVASVPRVVVDIVLVPRPQMLNELLVRGEPRPDSAPRKRARALDVSGLESTTLAGEAIRRDPTLADADALHSLSSRGLAVVRDEAPTSMHVRGGSASETGVTIDGIPVFNPYHAMGTLTALDPDVIASASLDRGAPTAAVGGATASTIGLTTSPANGERIETRGAFSSRALREAVSGPLPMRSSTFLVAVRRSLDGSLSDVPTSGANFGDLFAKVTMPIGGGELEAFAFHSRDQLSFAAASDQALSGRDAGTASDVEHDDASEVPPQLLLNVLGWNTGTDALRWHSDGDTRWDVRAWRTRFDADFAWAGTTQLANSLTDLGAATSAARIWRGVHLESGVSADSYDVRYRVSEATTSGSSPLALSGAPMLVSAFGEARWTVATRWSFVAGVRDALVAPSRTGLEPRLSARFSPSGGLSFGVGYARLHQYVQSLRNEESLFDAVAGISLPVVAGSTFNGAVVPAAQADQLTATADARLSRTLTFSANAYARNVTGLVLVAPVTGEPFATTAFAVGGARARGLSLSLTREGEKISGDVGYSLSKVTQSVDGLSYTPSYGVSHSVSAGMGFRVQPSTVLRVAMSLHGGAPTSLIADQVEWTPYTSSAGQGDLGGSPGRITGALDGSRLPTYARFDVGVRHDWRMRLLGRESEVTTSAALTNMFNRGNALGMLAGPAGSSALLVLPRRSATFGLEWKY